MLTSPFSSSAGERTSTSLLYSMTWPSYESVTWRTPHFSAQRPNSASVPLWPPL